MSERSKHIASAIVDLGGSLIKGIGIGTVSSLDAADDDKAIGILTSGLRQLSDKMKLPAARKRRLIRLLREALDNVESSL